jgi:multiple sugar transport system substrate-binding protein
MSSTGIKARRRQVARRALSASLLCLTVGGPIALGADPHATTWSQQYKGTTLRVIGEATINTQIIVQLAGDFEKKTGIKVVVEQAPYDSLVQKATLDFASNKGSYDVLSIPYEYLGAFAEKQYITPDVLKKGGDAPGYSAADIIPALWKASSDWKGKVYGAPSNSAVMMMFYRKDLFQNAAERQAFRTKYGYALAPARTWKEYREIAEFFTRRKGQTLAGKKLDRDFYGLTLTGKRHVATALEYFNYAWTYGGDFFTKSGTPAINSSGNVKGLSYELSLTKFAPPAYTTTTWDEMTTAFQQGTVAQALAWGDTAGGLEDAKASRVVGKMGYASIPVAAPGKTPIAHLGSWTYTVNADSRNQDASALFIKWALSRDVQTKMALRGGLPASAPVFKSAALIKKLPYWKQELVSLSQAKSRPRIPQWGAIAEVLQDELSKALGRSATPKKALDDAQKRVTDVLEGALPVTYQ